MSLHNDLFIDATRKGNISRFFNHSCDPNCETQKWTVNGELRIGFFTRRSVNANEELTFNYQYQTVGKKQQKCYCGSDKCRGFLGASSSAVQQTTSTAGALDYMWENSSGESSTDGSDSEEETESPENTQVSSTNTSSIQLESSKEKTRKDRTLVNGPKDHDVSFI